MKPTESDLRAAVVDFCQDGYGVVKIRRALSAWGWDVTVSDIKPIVADYRRRWTYALNRAIDIHMDGATGIEAIGQAQAETGIKMAESTLFRHLKKRRAEGNLAPSSQRPGARQRRPIRDIPTNGRPISFSSPMVRAILDGRKTQTRRIVTPQPIQYKWGSLMFERRDGRELREWPTDKVRIIEDCRFGKVGDRLWVRESWAQDSEDGALFYRADIGDGGDADDWERNRVAGLGRWRAVLSSRHWRWRDADDWERNRLEGAPNYRWRASMFMPRWASRILLEVTDVRLERVKDITGMDAKCEGAPVPDDAVANGTHLAWARGWFRLIWGEINGTDSWDANPWVWVIEFKRVHSGGEKMASGTTETRASSESTVY